jgi:hypothetical protein
MAENMLDNKPEEKTGKGTVKYEVTQTCWWNETLYHVEDTVELEAGLTPPKEYFKKL